mmetsp:Transcript_2629/g.8088  ORF Transcript_2629/g.8088 Transcript_2629/m.8088 type:complete len:302 (-) Transcript_2629:27-932(-)
MSETPQQPACSASCMGSAAARLTSNSSAGFIGPMGTAPPPPPLRCCSSGSLSSPTPSRSSSGSPSPFSLSRRLSAASAGGDSCMSRLLSTFRSWSDRFATIATAMPARKSAAFPALCRCDTLATSTPLTVVAVASAAVAPGSARSHTLTMTIAKNGSQVLMTWVKETERRTSETLVQRVPHSSSTEDTVNCLRHAHHRAGSRSLPKAKAAGSARPPAIICRLVSSMTSGRRAWERFIPMLKKRLATYQTAMRVGSAIAPVPSRGIRSLRPNPQEAAAAPLAPPCLDLRAHRRRRASIVNWV